MLMCRPQIEKYSRIIKCRSQFCVRSKPQQIAAYFKDMGSATFDILQSPNSIPIARVLVGFTYFEANYTYKVYE